ncbi:hypothetical protein LCGC14_2574070 [marine sediment metagenome]|uniref:Uncharacterized protein n=1 Tax=marine sediment metagenome TaxID=412755 RepID=A0A0F9AGE4_9ZZZZ
MSDQAEIRQYILFALDRLPAENAHHKFELMCKDLAKGNIIENIILATGPVAGVGDHGRDVSIIEISRPIITCFCF